MPHTVTTAITYRARIDSFYDLPEDKRPPRNLWDKPERLGEFFDEMFKSGKESSNKTIVNIDTEEVE